jgi:pyruvate formate lyase activating enzyme
MAAAGPLIFEIKRYALDDGPGIRTTVFFKGCNLHCPWCHNVESIDPDLEIGFFPQECIQCGDCVLACPVSACHLETSGLIDRKQCTRCGDCVEACPGRALRSYGRLYTVDELVEILLRDRAFSLVSGGGVTLSGGEPTLYMDYCAATLSPLKDLGFHTAIQTNGFFPWDEFRQKLLPLVDLVLIDVKLADGPEHRRYTGHDNERIIANLCHLLEAEPSKVLPRIPLIPGITATTENLTALSRLLREAGASRCALLPYNPTWFHKAESLGKKVDGRMPDRMLTPGELRACRELFSWAHLVNF